MAMNPQSIEAANTRAVMLKDEGRYDEARDYLHSALRAAREFLGEDNAITLSVMTNLSSLLQMTGKLDEAEPLCHEVLKNRREELGDHHIDTINSMINLGSLYEMQGKLDKAEPMRLGVLASRREKLGDGHEETLKALDSLASLRLRENKLEEALATLSEELQGHVKVFGRDCQSYLPKETMACISKAGELLAAQPNGGTAVSGYPAFLQACAIAFSSGERSVAGAAKAPSMTWAELTSSAEFIKEMADLQIAMGGPDGNKAMENYLKGLQRSDPRKVQLIQANAQAFATMATPVAPPETGGNEGLTLEDNAGEAAASAAPTSAAPTSFDNPKDEMRAILKANGLTALQATLEEEEMMDPALLRSFPDLPAALEELEVGESDARRLMVALRM